MLVKGTPEFLKVWHWPVGLPGVTVGDTITELGLLIATGKLAFWENRGQRVTLTHQVGHNFCNKLKGQGNNQ